MIIPSLTTAAVYEPSRLSQEPITARRDDSPTPSVQRSSRRGSPAPSDDGTEASVETAILTGNAYIKDETQVKVTNRLPGQDASTNPTRVIFKEKHVGKYTHGSQLIYMSG